MPESLYIVPFGTQVLAMTPSEFRAARERGLPLTGSTTPANGAAPEPLLTAQEIAQATPGVPSTWYLERARQGQIPHVKLGRYVRFQLGKITEHGAVAPPREPGGRWTRRNGV
jgi:hypothetical protein